MKSVAELRQQAQALEGQNHELLRFAAVIGVVCRVRNAEGAGLGAAGLYTVFYRRLPDHLRQRVDDLQQNSRKWEELLAQRPEQREGPSAALELVRRLYDVDLGSA